jgi:hypothetical protein
VILLGAEFDDERQLAIRIVSVCERHAEPFLRETVVEMPPE